MLRRWLVTLREGFCFNCSEELAGHHSRGALQHSLTYAGDSAAHLNITAVLDYGAAPVPVLEIQVSRPFEEAWLSFTVDYNAVVIGGTHVFQLDAPAEYTLDAPDAGAKGRGVAGFACSFQALAARYAALQDFRIDERLIDPRPGGAQFLGSFDFHLSGLA